MEFHRSLTIYVLLFFSFPLLAVKEKTNSEVRPGAQCPFQSYYHKKERKLFIPSTLGYKFLVKSEGTNRPLIPLAKTEANPIEFLQFVEGDHYMTVTSTTKQKYRLISDGSPPKTKVGISPAPKLEKDGWVFYGKNLFLSISSKDPLSGVKNIFWAQNTKTFVSQKKARIDYNSDGKFRIGFFACDEVGNRETLQSLRFKVDVTPPNSSLSEVKGSYSILNPESFIALRATDAGIGVEAIQFRFDNSSEYRSYQNEVSLRGLSAGKHSISYFATDLLGNKESLHVHHFEYDPNPPQIIVHFPQNSYSDGDLHYIAATDIITVDAKDNESAISSQRVWLEDIELKESKSPFSLQGKERLIPIKIKIKDSAGNIALQEKKVFLDNKPPEVSYEIQGASFPQGDQIIASLPLQIKLRAEDTASGVEDIFYCIDSSPCESYSEMIQIKQEGELTFSFYAIDRVSQKSRKSTLSFVLKDMGNNSREVAVEKAKKEWVSDKSFGAIGPKEKRFRLAISDTADNSGHHFYLTIPNDALSEEKIVESFRNFVLSAAGFSAKIKLPIDMIPPVSSHDYLDANQAHHNGKLYFGEGLKIQLTAKDQQKTPNSGVKSTFFSVNGREYSTYSKPLNTFLTEQNYTVRFYSTDRVGNTEDVQTLDFLIDLSPPSTKIVYSKPFYRNVIRRDTGFHLTSEDALSGVAKIFFAFNKDPFAEYSDQAVLKGLIPLQEGENILRFYAIDAVGNREKERTIPIVIDDNAPLLSIFMRGETHTIGKNLFSNKKSLIEAKAKDEFSGTDKIYFAIDGKDPTEYSQPIEIDSINDGSTISLWTVDKLENRSKDIVYIINKDEVAPKTTVKFSGPYYQFEDKIFVRSSTQINISAQDDLAGLESIYFRINSGDFEKLPGPLSFSDAGEKSLTFYAVDHVKNREEPQTFRIIVDTDSPLIVLKGQDGEKLSLKGSMNQGSYLYISATDSQAGIKKVSYRLNDNEEKLYRQPILLSKKGKIKLEIEAVDYMGAEKRQFVEYEVK